MNQLQGVQKRELSKGEKKGFSIKDLILIGVLLAAGAVLKFMVGSVISIGGAKPNFIIAMYCLGILLIRPRLLESAIIGLIAGAVCQFFPGTPYLNFISEFAGATVMSLMVRVPLQIGKLSLTPAVSTFVSTVVSGSLYVSSLFIFVGAVKDSLVAYIPLVLITALINVVIVGVLYIPLKNALKTGLR
jgi:hypothetical protein